MSDASDWLLPDLALTAIVGPKRLLRMHAYGKGPEGATCGQCRFLEKHPSPSRRMFFKCRLYGASSSAASDWRKKWAACWKFEVSI